MTLIENVDKTQCDISIEVDAELMLADECVELVNIYISKYGIDITPTKVFKRSCLPRPLLRNQTNLLNWFINRGFIRLTHRNIFFTELVLNRENRNLFLPLILSLSINAVSISDKYWLNPISTTEFIVNGAEISFQKKIWEDVNPFAHLYTPGKLEQFALYDNFLSVKTENISPQSLIWTTSGEQSKRWLIDENGYYLEKKLYKQQLENEIYTLDFFQKHGITVPDYSYDIKSLNTDDRYCDIYNIQTIKEGLCVIKKRCITDSDSYLEPLSTFVENSDIKIEEPIKRMFSQYNVNNSDIQQFINVISIYKQRFDVPDTMLDTQNMGLLIIKDSAIPAVWGRLLRDKIWQYSYSHQELPDEFVSWLCHIQ